MVLVQKAGKKKKKKEFMMLDYIFTIIFFYGLGWLAYFCWVTFLFCKIDVILNTCTVPALKPR